jgi:hypothetical protein
MCSRLSAVAIICYLDMDYYENKVLPKYSMLENEDYIIYTSEYLSTIERDNPPPYGFITKEFIFLKENKPYNIVLLIDIKNKELLASVKDEISSYCLDEAIKIYDSLSVYKANSIPDNPRT